MSKANATETDILAFLFNLTSMPSYGSTLYLSLHTTDPGESGDQTTNEVTTGAYASYARVGVSRDASGTGWLVSGNQSSNKALIQFPQCTGGSGATITHIAIGTAANGAGQILYSGILNNSLAVSNLIQPQFAIGGLAIQED